MKKILIPVDLTACSNQAMEFGFHLAAKTSMQTEITLLHVYHTLDIVSGEMQALKQTLLAKMQSGELPRVNFKVREEFSVRTNKATAIVDCCHGKDEFDLIVMGTHGEKSKIFIGSTAAAVIEKASVPVFVIPEYSVPFERTLNIAFATDFKEYDLEAFRKMVEFLKPFSQFNPFNPYNHTKIHLVHIVSPESNIDGNRKLNDLKDKVKQYGIDGCEIKPVVYHPYSFTKEELIHIDGVVLEAVTVKQESVAETLDRFIRDYYIDIITLVTHKRGSIIDEMFHAPSIPKKMIYHTKTPILVFPEK